MAANVHELRFNPNLKVIEFIYDVDEITINKAMSDTYDVGNDQMGDVISNIIDLFTSTNHLK
jgi:hypothetical protein